MHGKYRILRFKIIVSWVMGLYNLIGGNQGFGQDMLLPSSDSL
jgi:hypothetical protein